MIATYRSIVPDLTRTPTLSPLATPFRRRSTASSLAASSNSAYVRTSMPLSTAAASGDRSTEARKMSTSVRLGAARSARRSVM